MRACKKCERELQEHEADFCPACRSDKSHKWKRFVEAAVPIVAAVGIGVFKYMARKK